MGHRSDEGPGFEEDEGPDNLEPEEEFPEGGVVLLESIDTSSHSGNEWPEGKKQEEAFLGLLFDYLCLLWLEHFIMFSSVLDSLDLHG